jgi:hypothetical protein
MGLTTYIVQSYIMGCGDVIAPITIRNLVILPGETKLGYVADSN